MINFFSFTQPQHINSFPLYQTYFDQIKQQQPFLSQQKVGYLKIIDENGSYSQNQELLNEVVVYTNIYVERLSLARRARHGQRNRIRHFQENIKSQDVNGFRQHILYLVEHLVMLKIIFMLCFEKDSEGQTSSSKNTKSNINILLFGRSFYQNLLTQCLSLQNINKSYSIRNWIISMCEDQQEQNIHKFIASFNQFISFDFSFKKPKPVKSCDNGNLLKYCHKYRKVKQTKISKLSPSNYRQISLDDKGLINNIAIVSQVLFETKQQNISTKSHSLHQNNEIKQQHQ